MDQETVWILCIIGYVVVGALGLYTALSFVVCAVYFRDWSPGTVLKELKTDGPQPQGTTIYPDILEFLVALAVFWVCWHYSGDAEDMPHHLLRVTAYLVGSWVAFIGMTIAYILSLRGVVWWKWTQACVARHQKRHDDTHFDPDIFRVSGQDNDYTSTLLRASELALQHGYRYFVLLPEEDATQQSADM